MDGSCYVSWLLSGFIEHIVIGYYCESEHTHIQKTQELMLPSIPR